MEEYITACPRNCYSTCSFRVMVENNTVKRILPYEGNLATPEGPCIKGLSYIESTSSPDRIIHPLKRTNSGSFEQITMDEALDHIAAGLRLIRDKYGPHSILWYKGSGMSGLVNDTGRVFWEKFGGATTTYGNLCWPAGLEAVRLTLGEVRHNVPWDIENAKTIIIWGKNPAETNIQEIAFISRAREKGSMVIVIDPLRTPTADKADLLLSPAPGTDGALAIAVAGVMISEGLIDRHFIGNYVSGYEEFRKRISLSPADGERITGIPEADIRGLARRIASGGPVTIIPGYGLQRHKNGGQTIRSILALCILTGNLGKPGAGFNYANLQSYIFDDMKEPASYYPDALKDRPFRRTISVAKLGSDMLQTEDPPLKAAWIERANPVLQVPDTAGVVKAFNGLELKVVVEQFMTDTASTADIILPAKDIFEQSDIIGSYWSPYISYKPGIITAPGEVMPESEIYFHLAERLGLGIDTDNLPAPGNANIEKWLGNRIKGYSELTLEDLKKGPVLAPGLQTIAYCDLKFNTPSGRIELLSTESQKLWGVSPLPDYQPVIPEKEDEGYPLAFLTPNAAGRIHSQFGNLKIISSTLDRPSAMVSPCNAGERHVNTGDRIRIFNGRGEIFSIARISSRVPRGVVVLPNGIWFSEGGGGNNLIAGQHTDMGYGAVFHDTRVDFEKTGGS